MSARPGGSEVCPACNGAEEGCCVCDHTGRVWSGWLNSLPTENPRRNLRRFGAFLVVIGVVFPILAVGLPLLTKGCVFKAPAPPPPVLTPAAPLLAVPGVARWTGWLPGAVRRVMDLEPAAPDPAALEAKRREGEELGRREEARAMWRRHARHMGVLGGVCLALGLFTAAASFFVPLIPRKAAWVCFALCALLWVGQYAVTVYGVIAAELLVWGSVAFAAVAAWPWAMAVVRWSHARAGRALAANPAHVREGVALQAAAKGWTKERRKAELAKANERLQNLGRGVAGMWRRR